MGKLPGEIINRATFRYDLQDHKSKTIINMLITYVIFTLIISNYKHVIRYKSEL